LINIDDISRRLDLPAAIIDSKIQAVAGMDAVIGHLPAGRSTDDHLLFSAEDFGQFFGFRV
jgi:hypothetical protein